MASMRSTSAYIVKREVKIETNDDNDVADKQSAVNLPPTVIRPSIRQSNSMRKRTKRNRAVSKGKYKTKVEKKIKPSNAKKIKKLEDNLIASRENVDLIHVIPSEEVKFTIPSSDKKELYTSSLQIGNDDGQPSVTFKCDCGSKYGIPNRDNCKHIGRVVSFIVEEYVKNGMMTKPVQMSMGQITGKISGLKL